MNEPSISKEDLHIMDIILNLEPLLKHEFSGFWLSKDRPLETDQLNKILTKLLGLQLISLQKDKYQRETVSLNPLKKQNIDLLLSAFWKSKGIEKSKLSAEAPKDYTSFLKILEFKSIFDEKPRIGFSDYYRDSQSQHFCQRLTEIGMVFKHTSSSKKHEYEDYYLRKLPFSVEEILEDLFASKVNLEGLKLRTDWRALLILLFSETYPTVEDLKTSFPNLTLDEINEILFNLEKRGILSREGATLQIVKLTREIIKNYFLLHCYRSYKTLIIQELKNRLSERTSNLYLLGLLKKVLAYSKLPQKISEPFFSIKRTSIRNVSDIDLKEMAKLGLVFTTTQEIIVAHEVFLELEAVLKSALSEKTTYRVPAGEIFTAIAVWKEIFGKCKNYIKIEDEYVNEDALEIIQSYSPAGVDITILSSIKGARDLDIEEMQRRIKALKNSGRRIRLFFVGYKHNEAPFHERYIISKDVCYLLSTSMKQVGKSKSASITMIPQERKIGTIEPAFDYWIESPKGKLIEKGISRMSLEEWLKFKSATS